MSETDSNQTNQSQQPTPQPQSINQVLSNFNDTIPSTPRSAVTAGILGIFLGGFGAHNWYLGQKRRGLLHCVLFLGGLLILTIFGSLAAVTTVRLPILGIFFFGITAIGWIAMAGNSIWGLIEGIIILSQGDPALAAKGYTVPAPVVYQQPAAPTATPAPEATTAAKEKPAAKSTAKKSSK